MIMYATKVSGEAGDYRATSHKWLFYSRLYCTEPGLRLGWNRKCRNQFFYAGEEPPICLNAGVMTSM